MRTNPASDKLIVYLEGGGACFQGTSCFSNPTYFDASSFESIKTRVTGIFDFTNAANPFKDWNFVYVPYCTGDVHAGNADGVDVPGGGPLAQHFVGYGNMTRGLQRLVPTFDKVTQVVLSGSSAGGFGAAFNYQQVAQAFCPRPVTLIDDSGPPMTDQYLAACLQKRWRDLWQLDTVLPADCTDCRDAEGGGLVNYIPYLAAKYPDVQLGLISSDKDSVIPRFYGFGENMCAMLDQGGGTMTPDEFNAGLLDLRANFLSKSTNWGSFFISSTQHTWLGSNSFYRTTTTDGVAMADWVTGLITTHTSANVGP